MKAIVTILVSTAFSFLFSSNSIAQDAIFKLFNSVLREAAADKARKAWSRIPPSEAACIETALERQGFSIDKLANRGVRPSDDSIAAIRQDCQSANAHPLDEANNPHDIEHLSERPTFDCAKAKSATGRVVCMDRDGAAADWNMISASWAARYSIPETERKAFDDAEERWLLSLNGYCKLNSEQASYTNRQRQCVLRAYKERANQYRRRLSGDALDEANLSPEDHAKLQQALISRGFLRGDADGEFGEDTRAAIVRYHQNSGIADGVFLSVSERTDLLSVGGPTGQAIQSPKSAPTHNETPAIKRARIFLGDAKQFIASKSDAPNIASIANEANALKLAIEQSDEAAANSSIEKLRNLLAPISGYSEFVEAADAERKKIEASKLSQAQETLSKNAAFINGYIAKHLGEGKIPQLLRLCDDIKHSLKSETLEEIEKTNSEVEDFALSNGLSEEYAAAGLGPGAAEFRRRQEMIQQQQEDARRLAETKEREERERQEAEKRRAEEERQAAEQKVKEEEERKRAAEAEAALRQEQAAEKGRQFAQTSGTSWSMEENQNEMTDHTDILVSSTQTNDLGAVAEVTGICAKKGYYRFTAKFVDRSGQPIDLVQSRTTFGGDALVEDVRVNDRPADQAVLSSVDYANVLLIADLTTDKAELESFWLTQKLSLEDAWRVLTEVKTDHGKILIKIPVYDDTIQRMIKSCK